MHKLLFTLLLVSGAAHALTPCAALAQNEKIVSEYEAKNDHTETETWMYSVSKPHVESNRADCEKSKKPGVKLGMTHQQVINETSWGKPSKVNTTINTKGTFEQWVYRQDEDDFDPSFLYFHNGKLVSIQK